MRVFDFCEASQRSFSVRVAAMLQCRSRGFSANDFPIAHFSLDRMGKQCGGENVFRDNECGAHERCIEGKITGNGIYKRSELRT